MSETKYICCICGRKVKGYGNDPWPLKELGRCCDYCNWTVVLHERDKLRMESRLNNIKYKNGTEY